MDQYWVTYLRMDAWVVDTRVFNTISELERWLHERMNKQEKVIIFDITSDSRLTEEALK